MQGAENLLEGMQMFSAFANIENEIGLIKSTSVVEGTLDHLGFEVGYFTQGKVRTIERYNDFPLLVHIDTTHKQLIKKAFFVRVIDDETYEISLNSEAGKTFHFGKNDFDAKQEQPIRLKATYHFGEQVIFRLFFFQNNKE